MVASAGVALALAVSLLGAPTALVGSDVSVAVPSITASVGPFVPLTVTPGSSRQVMVEVTSTTAATLTASVEAVSTEQAVLSTLPTFGVTNPATWVSLRPGASAFEVAGGATVSVPVTISVPGSVDPGDYAAAVRVAEVSGGGEDVILPLLLRVDGARTAGVELTESSLSVSGSVLWPLTPSTQEITYSLRNSGDTIVMGDFSAGVATMFGGFVAVDAIDDAVLLPGDAVSGRGSASALPFGVLATEAGVDVPYVDSAQRELSYRIADVADEQLVLPVGLLAALAGLVVAITAWAVHRRSRARAADPEPGKLQHVE